jgi:hypothetical protein
MPKAAVDEYDEACPADDDIRPASEMRLWSNVEAESDASSMKGGAQRKLGTRIDTSIPLHHGASGAR